MENVWGSAGMFLEKKIDQVHDMNHILPFFSMFISNIEGWSIQISGPRRYLYCLDTVSVLGG